MTRLFDLRVKERSITHIPEKMLDMIGRSIATRREELAWSTIKGTAHDQGLRKDV